MDMTKEEIVKLRAEAIASFKESCLQNPEQAWDDLVAGKTITSVISVDLDMTKEEIKETVLKKLKMISMEDPDKEINPFFLYTIGRLLAEYDSEVMRTCDVPVFITGSREIFWAQKGLCHIICNALGVASDDFKALQEKTGQTVRNIKI